MSDETTAVQLATAPATTTEKEKKARKPRAPREVSTYVLRQIGKLWEIQPDTFDGIPEAEDWVSKNGKAKGVYKVLKGPTDAIVVNPRTTSKVAV